MRIIKNRFLSLFVIAESLLMSLPTNLSSSSLSFDDANSETRVQFIMPDSRPELSWSYFHPSWLREHGERQGDFASIGLIDPKLLAQDPEKRLEKDFNVPAALQDRVIFWTNVYAKYTSRMKILHDRENLGTVYGYIDLTPIYEKEGSLLSKEIRARRIERQIIKELRRRIADVALNENAIALHPLERRAMKEFLKSNRLPTEGKELATTLKAIRSQGGQRDMFLLALGRSEKFIPEMETVFEQHGLPKGLARIPFVESSFHEGAMSKVSAVGIWQFMPKTARAMIHRKERNLWFDPKLQTKAAARMLRVNRKLLPDWGSAVTAYNSGVGRVSRELRRAKGDSIEDLVEIEQKRGLGFAGKNFYSEFLAAHLLEVYRDTWAYSRSGLPYALAFEEMATDRRSFCSVSKGL